MTFYPSGLFQIGVDTNGDGSFDYNSGILNWESETAVFEIDPAYIQYRNDPDSSNNRYTAWAQVNKDGAPLENDDNYTFEIKNSTDNIVEPLNSTFYSPHNAYFYDCSSLPCGSPQIFSEGGFVSNFESMEKDTYKFEVESVSGQLDQNEDECLRMSVEKFERVEKSSDQFNNSDTPAFGYEFIVVEMAIEEINAATYLQKPQKMI